MSIFLRLLFNISISSFCISGQLWSQKTNPVAEKPDIVETQEYVCDGRTYRIEIVCLPPKDADHDYYPVVRVYRDGALLAEISPEMLDAGICSKNRNLLTLNCDGLEEDIRKVCEEEKRKCFGFIHGWPSIICMDKHGRYMTVEVQFDFLKNGRRQEIDIELETKKIYPCNVIPPGYEVEGDESPAPPHSQTASKVEKKSVKKKATMFKMSPK